MATATPLLTSCTFGSKTLSGCVALGLTSNPGSTFTQEDRYRVYSCDYIHTVYFADRGYGRLTHDYFDRPVVTFKEPPDRQILSLHAACARVVHLSGAFKTFNSLETCQADKGPGFR